MSRSPALRTREDIEAQHERDALGQRYGDRRPRDLPPMEGFDTCWMRESIHGQTDNDNLRTLYQQGWKPIRADEFPDYMADIPENFPGARPSTDNWLRHRDSIAMKRPKQIGDRVRTATAEKTRAQMLGVDANMFAEKLGSNMRYLNPERRSETTHGRARFRDDDDAAA